MDIKIRGYRGIERADLRLAPIALLVGLNFAGKSSICQAVAAALIGNASPFFRASRPDKSLLTKTDAKQLVRGGMDKGSVEVSFDGKVIASANWPATTAAGTGEAACSKYATGLINPMELDDAERQKLFSDMLKATPDDADLMAALTDAQLSGQVATDVKKSLALNGWDVAYKTFKDEGARLKGGWEAASGTAFGKLKATDWVPEGWREELGNTSLEAIGTQCTQAQAKVEAAVGALAVDAAGINDLQHQVDLIPDAEAKLATARGALDKATEQDAAARKESDSIIVPVALPCPHCGGMLDVMGTQTVGGLPRLEPAQLGAAEILGLAEKKKTASERVKITAASLAKATEAHQKAKSAYEAVKDAPARLKAAKARTGTQDAVDTARDFLSGLNRDKDRITAKLTADRLGRQIATNQVLVDILAPDGLRRQKLARALAEFNKATLAPLCAAAGYPSVTFDAELEVLYGGRRYFLLSASEQYRVRAVLQVAMAKKDGSQVVILDGADILDADGRDGLFSMLSGIDDLGILVAMTLSPGDPAPNLAELEMGCTYMVEGGIARALAVPEVAAA